MGLLCDIDDDGLVDNREVYVDDHATNREVFDLRDIDEVRARRRMENDNYESSYDSSPRYSVDDRYQPLNTMVQGYPQYPQPVYAHP